MDFNNTKIFITGASGFVGRRLTEYLLFNSNTSIFVLLRNEKKISYFNEYVNNRITPIIADICDIDKYKNILCEVDYIFHLAAEINFSNDGYEKIYKTNVVGTKVILNELMQNKLNLKCFMFMSSIGAIRRSSMENIIATEDFKYEWDSRPEQTYQYTKYLSECDVINASRAGLKIFIVNPSVIMGKGADNKELMSFLKFGKSKIFIKTKGGLNFIHVDDVISGMLKVIEKGKMGKRYILCGENVSYSEIIKYLNKLNGIKPLLIPVSKYIIRIIPKSKKLFTYSYFSSNLAIQELGWKTQYSWQDCLKETNEFVK